MSNPESRQGPYLRAPEDELLSGISAEGTRAFIEPVLSRGRFWRARLAVALALMAGFFGLPHLRINGNPALWMDLPHRQFHVLGLTLHPTDNILLLVFGAATIITVFLVTAILGRVWCGWGCPQTVYLEFLFRPLESLVEGAPTVRRRRDAGPWTLDRAWRKALKWSLFLAVALAMAATFVSYFTSFDGLLEALAAPLDHRAVLAAIGIVTAAEMLDFVWFREQTCTTACPYGRLQNVLYDPDTVIVGYDPRRGEPRAKLGPKGEPRTAGDCIDCHRCVTTCPTGIDIRKGLQMECVACTQCIDACDDVMDRIGKPRGLIRYSSLRELKDGVRSFVRPRLFVYGTILLAVYAAFWFLLFTRSPARVEVLRGSTTPYIALPDGRIGAQLRMRFTNQTDQDQGFTVTLLAPEGAEMAAGTMPLVVKGEAVETLSAAVKTPRSAFQGGKVQARFRIESDRGLLLEREFTLLGPY